MKSLFLVILLLLLSGCGGDSPLPAEPTPPAETAAPLPETTPATEAMAPLDRLLAAMTTEEKVGQLFLARCPDSGAVKDIETYHPGGYILFGRDFEGETPDSLKQILEQYQAASPIPLLLAVDEEGGTVTRVSSNPAFRETPFPSPRNLYERGGMEAVLAAETEKFRLLQSLGINVNMAPVCDITTEPGAYMYRRSIGLSPEETGQYVKDVLSLAEKYEIGCVLKHFPGYGNNADTHTGIAVDNRTLEALESRDIVPFTIGIVGDCDAILMSHTIVTALDAENPASLSPAAHAYLRQMQGFDGVIVTDDLVMAAIAEEYGAGEAAVLAVLAGNDLLCSTEYQIQYPAVLEAVESGRIPTEMLDNAVLRILRWKQKLGLIF